MLIRFLPAIITIVLDQATKLYAVDKLTLHQPVPVMPSFNFTLMYNEGAAFSFLSDAGGWQRWLFSGLAFAVSIFLIGWLIRLERREKWLALALSLILGGAIGNLIDRVAYGYVVDFVQWYYDRFYWPAFNIADAAITVGTVLLLSLSVFQKDESQGLEKS
ncbi:MAG TPA: signal peptidase II [Gammaproteobacteria bacterium]|nr:signal peptidase II [Gammaproteobacteria bacterium]